jgi:hypothetical protein
MMLEKVTVSLKAQLQLEPYENCELFISVKDLDIGASDSTISAAMDTANRTIEAIRADFRTQLVTLSAGLSRVQRDRLRQEINAEHAAKNSKTKPTLIGGNGTGYDHAGGHSQDPGELPEGM